MSVVSSAFLNPQIHMVGGTLSTIGQPLNRLQIPKIDTLISRRLNNVGELSMVVVDNIMQKAQPSHSIDVSKSNVDLGIQININLLGISDIADPASAIEYVNVSTIQQGKGSNIQRLPTTMQELKSVIHMVSITRSSAKNNYFRVDQLKQIAKNLNLESSGDKDDLVARLHLKVSEFFGGEINKA